MKIVMFNRVKNPLPPEPNFSTTAFKIYLTTGWKENKLGEKENEIFFQEEVN